MNRIGVIPALFAIAVAPLPSPPAWTLRHIDLTIAVDLASRRIDGAATLAVTAAPGSSSLVLDLSDSMTVDSARLDGSAGGVRAPGRLEFPVAARIRATTYRVTVWYHGQPIRRAVGFGTGVPGGNRAASYGLPNSAREWWPTLDTPAVKADSADIRIIAPASLVAVSVGRQMDRTISADGLTATTHWRTRRPVYSDAISFAVGDYHIIHSSPGDHLKSTPVDFYLFPEDSAKGGADFAATAQILAFYAERLGPYPFAGEKYALVEFARPSFREAQTLSHIGAPLITGTRANEQVFAHEIAHQWFGNAITVASWQDIWLNESLSEYFAWQWIQHARGDSAYQAILDSAVVAKAPAPIVPANPADFSTLFGNATFQRGPAVLVMLEKEIGTSAFSGAARQYVARHRYATVTTADFQRACEAAAHRSLAAFFDRWVRGNDPLPHLKA